MSQTAKSPVSLPISSVLEDAFKPYGTVLKNLDVSAFLQAGDALPVPKVGVVYHASEPVFEALPDAAQLQADYYGELPCQIGYCAGQNSLLNALEWHNCNEINIGIKDCVLILAKRADLDDKFRMDTAVCKAFLLPRGVAVEVYADTLHYCPCQQRAEGFATVVALPKGTNTDLAQRHTDRKLIAKNKWLIAHPDATELVREGAYIGLSGENFRLEY